MRIKRQGAKSGIMAQIMSLIFVLGLFSLMWIVFAQVVSPFQTLGTTNYPTGVYDTIVTQFMTVLWQYWPVIFVLFPMIIYGLISGQQRSPNEI